MSTTGEANMSAKQETVLNQYEGMFIFPESIREEALDEAVGRAKAEIEKLGGSIESTIRLGKRSFARKMSKQDGGHYFVIAFHLAGSQVAALQERYKLAGEVFRAQINRALPMSVKAEKKDGVAQ